ncbi:MAG: alpha/beta fold hydrolase [Alphaproteobacteria bacterium]|nr:alpha/beta fold hydrolase [Alphaproteobacteria bacterium]
MKLETFRRRFPVRRLRIDGLAWNIIAAGPRGAKSKIAPVLLMLPGTLGTAEIFWNQIVALRRDVRVISVSYPQVTEITRLADGLVRLLDRLGVERAYIVGSSLGGYLAQIFAARHPSRVHKILIGNSLSNPSGPHPSGQSAADLARLPGKFHRQMILGSVESWPEPEPVFRRLHAILRESGTRLLSARALKARVLVLRAGPEVPKLPLSRGQVEIIDCEDDPLIPPSTQKDVRRRYPGARHHRFRIGGHYPYIVRADAYTAVLRKSMGLAR